MRTPRSPRPIWLSWVLSFAALAIVTAVLLLLRGALGKAHIALAYLLVVLVGSAAGGGLLGVALSIAAFVCFNYLFLPPYATLVIADPLDWLVLVAFLVTGIVAAQLLSRAQQRAELARRRAQEVERLASLGAETLNVGRAEDALGAIANVIRGALGVARCEILVPGDQPAAPAAHVRDVPLRVRERSVGVLRLSHDAPIVLEPDAQRFLDALSYYAALGVERVRLTAAAERAEAFRQAGRAEQAGKEDAERALIEAYLPASASEEDVDAAIQAALAETGVTSLKQMGAVMKAAQARLKGKSVDGKALSDKVRSKLS